MMSGRCRPARSMRRPIIRSAPVNGNTSTWTMYAMPLIVGANANPPYNISVRGMALSPWTSQGDNAVYFSGFDAENTPGIHDTGWIAWAPASAVP